MNKIKIKTNPWYSLIETFVADINDDNAEVRMLYEAVVSKVEIDSEGEITYYVKVANDDLKEYKTKAMHDQQLCAGYIWVYHGDPIPQATIDYLNAQKVYQYDSNGYYVGEFENRKAAAKAIGYSGTNSHIGRCIKEPWRKAGGYYWRDFRTDKINIS